MFSLMILSSGVYPMALLRHTFTSISGLEIHHALCRFCFWGISEEQWPEQEDD